MDPIVDDEADIVKDWLHDGVLKHMSREVANTETGQRWTLIGVDVLRAGISLAT